MPQLFIGIDIEKADTLGDLKIRTQANQNGRAAFALTENFPNGVTTPEQVARISWYMINGCSCYSEQQAIVNGYISLAKMRKL